MQELYPKKNRFQDGGRQVERGWKKHFIIGRQVEKKLGLVAEDSVQSRLLDLRFLWEQQR